MILECLHQLNNIDDSQSLQEVFETHGELNQQLFDQNMLRRDVHKRLLEIADAFVSNIQEDNIPINVIDYWLVGSNASYNYSPKSDIDVHIIVNVEDLGVDPYILKTLYDYIKSSFNNKYDIMIKGHEVELYLEDVKSNAVTNGIYSLKQDKWIKEPIRTEILSYDVTETDEYKEWLDKYESLSENEVEDFINDLYLMRKESLAKDGEWGTGNLVFKEFRNQGILQDLKDRKYKYRSKELTLEGLNEDLLCEKVRGQTELKNFLCECINTHYPGVIVNPQNCIVHHIDLNHTNNSLNNLSIIQPKAVTTQKAHAYHHKHGAGFIPAAAPAGATIDYTLYEFSHGVTPRCNIVDVKI